MKYTKRQAAMGLIALTLAWSGWAKAQCGITNTNAASVQEDSGNGTYNCTVLSTSNGTLQEVAYYPTSVAPGYSIDIETDGTVTWSVATDDNNNPLYDVDLVSVARNSGQRCNYSYPDQPIGGSGLTTSDGGDALYVTICADGNIEAPLPPPPPEPISTLGNECEATFGFNLIEDEGDVPITEKFEVAIGYTKQFLDGDTEGVAICTDKGGQRECVNECVPTGTTAENCTVEEGIDGELHLDCAQCEYEYPDPAGSTKDLKYCWYWENRVCDSTTYPIEIVDGVPTPTKPGYCNTPNRTDMTYIPSPKKKSLNAKIDVTTGSDCYTVTVGPLYGGYTYSYQYCP